MDAPREQQAIAGYDYGTNKVAKSPISMKEWEELKKSALFSEEDIVHLRLSEEVLADHVDDLLKIWRGIIFDHPHLRAYNEDPKTHQLDSSYTEAVGKRLGQWVLDTARALRSGMARLSIRNRAAPPSLEEKQDGPWPHSESYPRP